MTRLWDVVLIPVALHVCMSMAEHRISLPICKVQRWKDAEGVWCWLACGWMWRPCLAQSATEGNWINHRRKKGGGGGEKNTPVICAFSVLLRLWWMEKKKKKDQPPDAPKVVERWGRTSWQAIRDVMMCCSGRQICQDCLSEKPFSHHANRAMCRDQAIISTRHSTILTVGFSFFHPRPIHTEEMINSPQCVSSGHTLNWPCLGSRNLLVSNPQTCTGQQWAVLGRDVYCISWTISVSRVGMTRRCDAMWCNSGGAGR